MECAPPDSEACPGQGAAQGPTPPHFRKPIAWSFFFGGRLTSRFMRAAFAALIAIAVLAAPAAALLHSPPPRTAFT